MTTNHRRSDSPQSVAAPMITKDTKPKRSIDWDHQLLTPSLKWDFPGRAPITRMGETRGAARDG
jgi:hypothetical protein